MSELQQKKKLQKTKEKTHGGTAPLSQLNIPVAAPLNYTNREAITVAVKTQGQFGGLWFGRDQAGLEPGRQAETGHLEA